MAHRSGKFVLSLDFELMWGMRDIENIATYGQNVKGVHTAVPRMLDLFQQYDIHATFAIVGFVFFTNKKDLLTNLPKVQPQYADKVLSPYGDYMMNTVDETAEDPYHFGADLVQQIKNSPGQEIGTHTFSHFYCLEEGQTYKAFQEDLKAAIAIAQRQGIKMTSIVFPRNQVNEAYLEACANLGITAFRSNEKSWIYTARSTRTENLFRRFFRLLDAYANITGHHCYPDKRSTHYHMIDIPSSRFLRPYSPSLALFEDLRLQRIKASMSHAARHGLLYHLWSHPHNFGIHQDKNFLFLEKILQHYSYLNKKYDFKNYTMAEYAEMFLPNKIQKSF